MREIIKYVKAIKNYSIIPILDNALIKDGKIIITDLERFIILETNDKRTGLIDKYGLCEVLEKGIKLKDVCLSLTINDFPEVPEITDDDFIGVIDIDNEIKDLKAFCYDDKVRPYKEVIFFDNKYIVATNAWILKRIPLQARNNFRFVINARLLNEMPNGNYDVFVKDKYVAFEDEEKKFILHTEQTNYPNYLDVFPDKKGDDGIINFTIKKEILIHALKEAFKIWENQKKEKDYPTKKAIIKIQVKENNALLLTSEYEENKYREIIFVEKITRSLLKAEIKDFIIGFDIEFLLICLNSFDKKVKLVTFKIYATNKPVLINDHTLIMPIL